MLETALKLLNKIEEAGFRAYIVGGFVRDYLLGIDSNDIDVCTNARPVDLRDLFQDACIPNEEYGAVTVMMKSIRFEITTFRRELQYQNNRKPVEIEYIQDLEQDLMRRDLRINTLCMDRDGQVIDLLQGKQDLDDKIIHTVGDPVQKFSEDSLRILRAVRISTNLQFGLAPEVKEAILKTKHLLKFLSYQRKKEELDKIFTGTHVRDGVLLLLELGLDQVLELSNLRDLGFFEDILGIWALLDPSEKYPFTRNEREQMEKIRAVLPLDNLDIHVLYRYGLYPNSIAAKMKGLDYRQVTQRYNDLPIKARNEIVVDGKEVAGALKKEPGVYLKQIFDDLEERILSGDLANEKQDIFRYLEKTFVNV